MNMMNGWLILSIVALLFLSMYIYAYIFVYFEKIKNKKFKKREAKRAEIERQEKVKKEELRAAKFDKLKTRSKEIKAQLKWLEQMNKNIAKEHNIN